MAENYIVGIHIYIAHAIPIIDVGYFPIASSNLVVALVVAWS